MAARSGISSASTKAMASRSGTTSTITSGQWQCSSKSSSSKRGRIPFSGQQDRLGRSLRREESENSLAYHPVLLTGKCARRRLVLGRRQSGLFREIDREGFDLFGGQRFGEAAHDGILALAEPVVVERLGEVVGVLAGERRVLGDGARAVVAVAGAAGADRIGRLSNRLAAALVARQRIEIRGEIRAIGGRQRRGIPLHGRMPAGLRVVFRERRDDVLRALATELRYGVFRVGILVVLAAVAAHAGIGQL